jgi:hypothetical protein
MTSSQRAAATIVAETLLYRLSYGSTSSRRESNPQLVIPAAFAAAPSSALTIVVTNGAESAGFETGRPCTPDGIHHPTNTNEKAGPTKTAFVETGHV